MKQDVLNNKLSTLTNIPTKLLNKLDNLSIAIISDAIYDMKLSGETEYNIEFSLGNLIIKFVDDTAKFKFVPNAKLIDTVQNPGINGYSKLADNIAEKLSTKIITTYKEFL